MKLPVRFCALALAAALGPVASAATLWNQLPDGESNFANQEFPDLPTFSVFVVDDFHIGGGGWNVDGISVYAFVPGGVIPDPIPVRVNVFSKTGALPSATDDPLTGLTALFDVVSIGPFFFELRLDYVPTFTAPGDYWLGVTPIIPLGQFGQSFQLSGAPVQLDPAAVRNPGGGFGVGTNWVTAGSIIPTFRDMAFQIRGVEVPVVPIPAALPAGLMLMGGLMCRRRRRPSRLILR